MSMTIKRICVAEHRGALQDCLKTERSINVITFCDIVNEYTFYAFDERIGCYRFVIRDLEKNYIKRRDWLHLYV